MSKNSIDPESRKTSGKSHLSAEVEVGRGPLRASIRAQLWNTPVGVAILTGIVIVAVVAGAALVIWLAAEAVK